MRAEPAPLLPPAIVRAVYDHAAAEYPRECCGLLLGPADGPVDEARRCANAQHEWPVAAPGARPRDGGTAFCLGLDDVRALAASLDGPRPARVLYHSHVDAPARLSAADVQQALLGGAAPAWPLLHLVVEVQAGVPRHARLYSWEPAARRFREAAAYTETGAPARAAL